MSNTEFVLDASALIAALQNEPGGDRVMAVAQRSVVGAVNLGEVVGKLQELGYSDKVVDQIVENTALTIVPFDTSLAIATGRLRCVTRHAGLSLGDRACLALGRQRGAVVLTADRAWATLDVGVTVELIR